MCSKAIKKFYTILLQVYNAVVSKLWYGYHWWYTKAFKVVCEYVSLCFSSQKNIFTAIIFLMWFC